MQGKQTVAPPGSIWLSLRNKRCSSTTFCAMRTSPQRSDRLVLNMSKTVARSSGMAPVSTDMRAETHCMPNKHTRALICETTIYGVAMAFRGMR